MPSVKLQDAADVGTRRLSHLDPRTRDRLHALEAAMLPPLRLRRTGAAPLLFHGRTLATVCGVTPALPFWYELNLHRATSGTHVTDIRLFWKALDFRDVFRVAEHDSAELAFAHFERHAAMDDAVLPAEMTMVTSAPILALAAIDLRVQMRCLSDHYAAMVDDLLHTLTPPA